MFSYFSGTKSQATTTINDTNNSSNVSHPSVEEEITVSSMLSKSPKSSIAQPSMKDLPEEEIEYLTIKDNPYSKNEIKPTGSFGVLPMRNNSDKLQYGTGSMYVTGLASGGLYGFFRGWNKSSGSSFKLRLNSVLNTTTRFGPWLIYFYPHSIFIFRAANSIGVMTLGYSLVDISLEKIRGKSDYINHMSSGFISGLIFKSSAGLKPALLTGSILASIVGAYCGYDMYQKDELKLPMTKMTPSSMESNLKEPQTAST